MMVLNLSQQLCLHVYLTYLVNGTSGIAVGMATNIPPHNLTEVINGCLALIENQDITLKNY